MPNVFTAVVHYLARLSVCLPTTWQNHLVGEITQKFMYLSSPFLYNRMFIYTFSMFFALCCVRLVCTIKKCCTITCRSTWHVPQCHVSVCFFKWSQIVNACPAPPLYPHPPLRAILILSFSSPLSFIFSSHLITHPSHPLLSAHFFSSSLDLSPHFSALLSSLSIIIYLHSVHFLPSLMALRWGVFLVRNCNEDWNTISWIATVSFLHHPPMLQSDRCCCCCFGFPVCSYWCVSSSLSRYC